MQEILLFLDESTWMYRSFLILFGALILDIIWRRVLRALSSKIDQSKNRWDDAFFSAARLPVSAFIWLFGVFLGLKASQLGANQQFMVLLSLGRDVIGVLITTWFLLSFIQEVEKAFHEEQEGKTRKFDQTSRHAISKLLRISVFIIAGLVILETFGYSLKGVLAFGGIGGIAVGFAAKDLLANFFGGLMIFLDRPFALGEWIRSPDRAIEGTVEHIGWRLTRIRTFDQRPLYIPNSVFTSICVENPSRMSNRRIYENIGIQYENADKLPGILDEIEQMLKSHKAIDQSKILMVNFNAYSPSALEFFIYTFTKTTQWMTYHQVKQDILLEVMSIIKSHGASIAYPTQRLLVDPETFKTPQQA